MNYEPEQLKKMQKVLLDIVKDIDRVCKEHGIEYFLDSGSCLGAVRHNGFIPWDDDMDLGMRRVDYDKFLRIAPSALGDDYVVAHPGNDSRLAGMFAKVWKRGTVFATEETIEAGVPQGIFVDVFPYDVVDGDQGAAAKQLGACRTWQSISYLYHAKTITVPDKGVKGAIERIGCRVVHGVVHAALTPETIREKFESAALSGAANPGGHYAPMAYTAFGPFPEEVLFPTTTCFFEGVELPVPGKYEQYLESAYGQTWTELPPEEDRRNHAPVTLDFGE